MSKILEKFSTIIKKKGSDVIDKITNMDYRY